MNTKPRILIAGVGNELRQDDAFGIDLSRKLVDASMPAHVKVMEVGTGGIHLVQELYNNYDILLILDAVNWGGRPGEIYFKEMEVGDIKDWSRDKQREFLADMHYTNPSRALMLAKALNILPKRVLVLGCEAAEHDDFAIGISEAVKDSIPLAVIKIKEWLNEDPETIKDNSTLK